MARLEVTFDGTLAHIRLVRPEAANAIDLEFAQELEAAAHSLSDGVRAVLVTADGPHFCAGGDVKAFARQDDLSNYLDQVTRHLHAGIVTLTTLDAPVVMAVHGAAAGAGLGLVCAADLVVAGRSARFLMAYTRLGLTPDGSSSWYLPRIVGLRRSLDLALTNRQLDANEAFKCGLVSRIVDDTVLSDEAHALARELADGPTSAYGATARLLRAALSNELPAHLDAERKTLSTQALTGDAAEGIRAFVERRPPVFGAD
jgi:2-(1,2-epoxy-1,2-dihydrophenyl)acetyl-CoA isomerase